MLPYCMLACCIHVMLVATDGAGHQRCWVLFSLSTLSVFSVFPSSDSSAILFPSLVFVVRSRLFSKVSDLEISWFHLALFPLYQRSPTKYLNHAFKCFFNFATIITESFVSRRIRKVMKIMRNLLATSLFDAGNVLERGKNRSLYQFLLSELCGFLVLYRSSRCLLKSSF